MALNLLTVLKIVPWRDVLSNAPAVAEGAKKLWGSVARKSAKPADDALAPTGPPTPIEARVTALERAGTEWQEQLRASTELITALAEQNTQLVQRIERNRRLIWRLYGLVGVLAGLGVAAWVNR